MANLKTAIAEENEIMKATDFTFGYDSSIANVATALRAVLSNSQGDYIVGGRVTPYGSGGLNVSVGSMYAHSNNTQTCVVETEVTEPISFERADNKLNRIDVVQCRAVEEGYDLQSRKFNDPATGTKTLRRVATKKRIKLEVSVKRGYDGSAAAPAVDVGYVKLAEVIIPAGTTNITEDLIKNVTARKHNEPNEEWTTNRTATFNPGYLVDMLHQFLKSHNDDGSHKVASIKAAHIDFGTTAAQVKGSDIPTGQRVSVRGADFASNEDLTKVIVALSKATNDLYKYASDAMSRLSFTSDSPVVASTENVDVATGGIMTIDGVSVSAGQLVFLKDQNDKRQNGLWEVQTGAWNRYKGYTEADKDCFTYKLIPIDAGGVNKGRIYFLNDDSYKIGEDNLEFRESAFSYFSFPGKVAIRDRGGKIKDVERLAEDLGASASALVDEGKSRNLLDVLGIRVVRSNEPATVDEAKKAMDILHKRINADGQADWRDLRLGDYLDLPELNDGETTYKWRGEYKNLRVVISAFNFYKNTGSPENKKNHIVFTFKNCVCQKKMNDDNINKGGYSGSKLAAYLDGGFKTGLEAVLGKNLYAINRLLSTKGSWAWEQYTVFLPTEREVWGTCVWGEQEWDGGCPGQIPIFREGALYKVKLYNGSRTWWWLATPYKGDGTYFCDCHTDGTPLYYSASTVNGVSPAFCAA